MASPSFHTKQAYMGDCQKCGKLFTAGNAMGLAAQHFERCGGYISLDVTTTFVWEPGYAERKQREKEECVE